jgi:prepilin-type N-terminal cleavage/methylation domain-containing protein
MYAIRKHLLSGTQNHPNAFSLIELMVALSLSGIAVTLVFYSWKYISHHTITQQRKTLFQTDADRIAQSIVAQIRKSPEVVTIAQNTVGFLSQNGSDTITYEFSGGVLRKNNTEVLCNSKGAKITQFSIENEVVPVEIGEPNSIMLILTVGFEDKFGNTSVIPLKVKATLSPERLNMLTGKWNF